MPRNKRSNTIRTTLEIDKALLAAVERENSRRKEFTGKRRGHTLTAVVEESLRSWLAESQQSSADNKPILVKNSSQIGEIGLDSTGIPQVRWSALETSLQKLDDIAAKLEAATSKLAQVGTHESSAPSATTKIPTEEQYERAKRIVEEYRRMRATEDRRSREFKSESKDDPAAG